MTRVTIVSSQTVESGGRRSHYHTLSDGRVIGYWPRRDPETERESSGRWSEVAPPVPLSMLEGGR